MIRRPLPLILALIVGVLVLVIINLLIGSVRIPMIEVCRILMGDDSNEIWTNIIFSSRLPQALTAIVAGAGLAVSGLQMQTVFRNPLAGPSVLAPYQQLYRLRHAGKRPTREPVLYQQHFRYSTG